jgi:hypothetical protein
VSNLPPFVRHSQTSREAAIEAYPNAGTQRALVLDELRKHPFTGLTDHQMQEVLGMNPSTQRPRRVELVNAGLVVESGFHRLTPSGRKAMVWIVATSKPAFEAASDGQMRMF